MPVFLYCNAWDPSRDSLFCFRLTALESRTDCRPRRAASPASAPGAGVGVVGPWFCWTGPVAGCVTRVLLPSPTPRSASDERPEPPAADPTPTPRVPPSSAEGGACDVAVEDKAWETSFEAP